MKILYDHQVFSWQKFGGISRYFYELMKNSKGLFEYDVSGLYFKSEYIKLLSLYKEFPLKIHFRGKWRIIKLFNKLNSIKKIKKKNYDIFHPTYYDLYILRYIKNNSLVADSYNMIHDKNIQYYHKDYNRIINKMIFTNVQKAKNNLLYIHPEIHEEKKEQDPKFLPVHKQNTTKQEYILFTGNRGGYKNFERFIIAIAPLLIHYNLRLICTGDAFSKKETDFIKQYKIDDRIVAVFASECELREYYAKALAFVFPSLYEGFGFPILEAFTTGCPAILSNTSCFPEIAEDAAAYFNPYSIDDIRQTIEKVLLDSFFRATLINKGFERVKYFSWEKTVKETYKLYREALSVAPLGKVRLVLTVHDMIHEFFPEYFPSKDQTVLNKYIMMRNADKIIAISNNTKMDILKLYPEIDEKKIKVIYHGAPFNE